MRWAHVYTAEQKEREKNGNVENLRNFRQDGRIYGKRRSEKQAFLMLRSCNVGMRWRKVRKSGERELGSKKGSYWELILMTFVTCYYM